MEDELKRLKRLKWTEMTLTDDSSEIWCNASAIVMTEEGKKKKIFTKLTSVYNEFGIKDYVDTQSSYMGLYVNNQLITALLALYCTTMSVWSSI